MVTLNFRTFLSAVIRGSALLASLAVASLGNAAVVYSHTAGPFGGSVPNGIPASFVTNPMSYSFTTANAFAANLSSFDASANVLSWTGGSGVPGSTITSTQANTGISFLLVWTDATGNVTNWQLQFFGQTVLGTDPVNEYIQSGKPPGTSVVDQIQFERQVNGFRVGTLAASSVGSTGLVGIDSGASGSGGTSGGTGTGSTVPTGAGSGVPLPGTLILCAVALLFVPLRKMMQLKSVATQPQSR